MSCLGARFIQQQTLVRDVSPIVSFCGKVGCAKKKAQERNNEKDLLSFFFCSLSFLNNWKKKLARAYIHPRYGEQNKKRRDRHTRNSV